MQKHRAIDCNNRHLQACEPSYTRAEDAVGVKVLSSYICSLIVMVRAVDSSLLAIVKAYEESRNFLIGLRETT